MIPAARFGTAARAFGVAAILGMALAFLDQVALQGTVMLAAVAATAIAADLSSRLPEWWIVVAEAALTSLVIGLVLPEGVVLLPYLVVPALLLGERVPEDFAIEDVQVGGLHVPGRYVPRQMDRVPSLGVTFRNTFASTNVLSRCASMSPTLASSKRMSIARSGETFVCG